MGKWTERPLGNLGIWGKRCSLTNWSLMCVYVYTLAIARVHFHRGTKDSFKTRTWDQFSIWLERFKGYDTFRTLSKMKGV